MEHGTCTDDNNSNRTYSRNIYCNSHRCQPVYSNSQCSSNTTCSSTDSNHEPCQCSMFRRSNRDGNSYTGRRNRTIYLFMEHGTGTDDNNSNRTDSRNIYCNSHRCQPVYSNSQCSSNTTCSSTDSNHEPCQCSMFRRSNRNSNSNTGRWHRTIYLFMEHGTGTDDNNSNRTDSRNIYCNSHRCQPVYSNSQCHNNTTCSFSSKRYITNKRRLLWRCFRECNCGRIRWSCTLPLQTWCWSIPAIRNIRISDCRDSEHYCSGCKSLHFQSECNNY